MEHIARKQRIERLSSMIANMEAERANTANIHVLPWLKPTNTTSTVEDFLNALKSELKELLNM